MFASKTIAFIRAPDEFPFIPPFNLVEGVFLIPLSFVLSRERYDKLSRLTMTLVYFIPLSLIAIYEGRYDSVAKRRKTEEAMVEETERSETRTEIDGDEDELVDEMLHRTGLERQILREGGSSSSRLCRDLRSALRPANATQGEKIHQEVTQLRTQLEEIKSLLKGA